MSKFTDLIENINTAEFGEVDSDVLSTERFRYPDMGDFYLNAVNDPYYKRLEEAMVKVGLYDKDPIGENSDPDPETGNVDDQLNQNSQAAMSFYYEAPPVQTLGDHQDKGVIFFKASLDLNEKSKGIGLFDADTLPIHVPAIQAGDEETRKLLTGHYMSKMIEMGIVDKEDPEKASISVRLLGINAPEVEHWYEEKDSKDNIEANKSTRKYGDIKNNRDQYVILRTEGIEDGEVINVYKDGNKWRQYKEVVIEGKRELWLLSKMEETDPLRIAEGKRIQDKVQKLIQAAGGDVYFMIDRVSLNTSNDRYPTLYKDVNAFSMGIDKYRYYWSQVKDYNRFKYSGYSQWGQDAYGRWMGNAYIKFNGQWINLAKYVLTQSKLTEALPDYTSMPSYEAHGGLPAEIFGLHKYDYRNRVVYDIHNELAKEMDDRRRVQEDIFNIDFDKMKEWNVTIGDCTFFVPPTSIRVNQQTTHERLPVLRGKGSLTKGSQKIQKMIELTLYFNEDRGINGFPYKDKLPNGQEVTYYMNGLRSLIAQFKFTPFLPIENDYINRILNIDAVTLVNMQIVTNPSMPRLLTCVLTMHEFDYLQYMPEIPLNFDNAEDYYNPFSTTFNFELMRWYYQRAIRRGEELKTYSINDKEYMIGIEGCRTALFPMDFNDSYFKIFVANEDHLKKMHRIKVQKNNSSRTYNKIDQNEENLIADLAPIYNAYLDLEDNDRVKGAISAIMSLPKGNQFLSPAGYGGKSKEMNGLFSESWLSVQEPRATGKPAEVMKSSEITKLLNTLVSETSIVMYQANIQKPLLSQSKTYLGFDSKKMTFGIVYKINSEHMSDAALASIIDAAEIQMGSSTSLNKYIKSGNIVVEYELPLKEGEGELFVSHGGAVNLATYKADGPLVLGKGENAKYIGVIFMMKDLIDGKGNANINDEVDELNEDIDNNMLETLQYDEIELGEVRIKNLACVYGNNLTQIGLNGSEGYAAQYLGGQDTIIDLGIETTDEFSVGMLNGLPKLASYLVTNYRLILPSVPIRFESEISRLLGVAEAVIENVEISTVPGQPGLYRINMRLVSVDRTLRHREGIRKVNEIANGGITTDAGKMDIKLRTFDELQTRFGEAELYPDLELPTIEELKTSGFDFLRHKFDHTRIYPDPDFYFNYGHVLQSEIFRESVMSTELDSYDVKYNNTKGEYVVTEAAKGLGVTESDKSDSIQNFENACSKAESMVGMSSSKKMTKYIDNHIPVLNVLETASSEDVWEIGEEIRVMLMEEPYAKMLSTHERGIESGETISETKWLYEKLEGVRRARKMIDDVLSEPMDTEVGGFFSSSDATSRWLIKDYGAVAMGTYSDILKELGVSDMSKALHIFGELAFAAACAKTGNKEYRKGLDKEDYQPDPNFIGYKISSQQDSTGVEVITDPTDVTNAVEFGPYRTRMYSESEIRAIFGDRTEIRTREKNPENINTYMFLLDPYYASKASLDEIANYKKAMIADMKFATKAFARICLVWLRKLIDDKLFPNLNFDILSKDFEDELELAELATEIDSGDKLEREEEKQISEQINQYIDFLKDIERPMDSGKMFLMASLAVCGMDLYDFIKTRSFRELNQLKTTLTSTSVQFESGKPEHMELRRFLFAMIPAKIIDGVEDLSSRYDDTLQKYRRTELDRKYIEFAEDPDVYTRHAFYDMCVHDMRGRMARAFPSFYIVLVDEGREIGMYKLNDNFYNVNAISEIQVHKSRKIPADTCRIVMSNLFHTFTQDDEDKIIEYEYSPLDVFNSIFRPGEIYRNEQEKRLRQQPLNKVKLTPGTRIHVRMGYGANAATLPVAFNGKITEVNAGDVMEIVCQGDGIELAQPILDDIDADEVDNADKLFGGFLDLFDNASTPKEILTALLTLKGGYWQKKLREWTNGLVQNHQRYGYINFGDINYTKIFKNGEAVQNIFEGVGKPMWGSMENGVESDFNTKEAPKLSIELMGKSFWDVLHICASATPDFIGATAPFGMRSTVFHGHPRFYYAFDYITTESGNIYEKRKPFQQYHIVTSYADIIANNIKADASRIKTNAIGTFKAAGNTGLLGTRINQTPRLYVDWDIYPENQKSMIYDTQFYDKGIPLSFGFGKAIQWTDRIFDYTKGENEDKANGSIQNGYPIAKRMTANALKNSIKDMYTGEIILMGSPSLKPHDRMYMMDIYENMSGQVLVEAVTHSLTVDSGLTSSVTPDCISAVDDQFERGTRNIANYIAQSSMLGYAAILVPSILINRGKGYKPLTTMSTWGARKIAEKSGKIVTKLEGAVSSPTAKGAKAALKASKVVKTTSTAIGKLGVGTAAGGLPGFLAATAWIVAEAGLSFMIGGMSNIIAQEYIKNAQVLTIFPLMHNGKVMTAGLAGSTGLIYGSTNFNKLGTLEKAFTYLDTESNGLSGWTNFVIDLFITQDIQDAARKYATKAIDGSIDEDVQFETTLADVLKGVASRESNRISGYEKLLISPRVQVDDKSAADKFTRAFEVYGLTDSRMLETQARISSENTYIKNDADIEEMMNKGFLLTIWDKKANDVDYTTKVYSIGGYQTEVKIYKKKTSDGETLYDLPFLKDDALSIMKTILSEAKKLMPRFEPEKEIEHESTITITSALIVGGDDNYRTVKKSMANTGYSFTLEASGVGADSFLIKAIKKMYDHGVKEYTEGRSINKEVFVYNHMGGNKYQITVLPPDLG